MEKLAYIAGVRCALEKVALGPEHFHDPDSPEGQWVISRLKATKPIEQYHAEGLDPRVKTHEQAYRTLMNIERNPRYKAYLQRIIAARKQQQGLQ